MDDLSFVKPFVDELPIQERMTIEGLFYEQVSAAEVARRLHQVTGEPVSRQRVLEVYLRRAVKTLRKELEPLMEVIQP